MRRLPNNTHRHNIYGKTGSGKTVVELFSVEKRDIQTSPWVIVDIKRDPTIARIPRLEEIGIDERIPREPGLYVVRPFPDDHASMEEFFWRVWRKARSRRGGTGLCIDEAAMINPRSKSFNAICTQGRSMRIPLICCTQRPAWLGPYTMSEADFHQVLFLNKPEDVKRLKEWVPALGPMEQNYHSQYYDVAKDRLDYLAPTPNEEEVLDRLDGKVGRRIRLFHGLFQNAGSQVDDL